MTSTNTVNKINTDFKPSPTCPICSTLPTTRAGNYFHCSDCDHWFSNLTPDIEKSDNPRNQFELSSYQHTRTSNYLKILKVLTRKCKVGSSLLEVGCADGMFLKLAREKFQFRALGIEPNTKMPADNPFNQDIIIGSFPEVLVGDHGKYDAIALNCALEYSTDVNRYIDDLKHYLASGGVIAIRVPVSSGLMFRVARGLNRVSYTHPFERLWQKESISPRMNIFSSKSIQKLFANRGLIFEEEIKLSPVSLVESYSTLGFDKKAKIFWKIIVMPMLFMFYLISTLLTDSKVFFFKA